MVTKCDQKAQTSNKMKPVIKAVVLNKVKAHSESLESILGCPPADI